MIFQRIGAILPSIEGSQPRTLEAFLTNRVLGRTLFFLALWQSVRGGCVRRSYLKGTDNVRTLTFDDSAVWKKGIIKCFLPL